jgi:hypothetical protein
LRNYRSDRILPQILHTFFRICRIVTERGLLFVPQPMGQSDGIQGTPGVRTGNEKITPGSFSFRERELQQDICPDLFPATVFVLWYNRRFPHHRSKNRTASTGPSSLMSASIPCLCISFSVFAFNPGHLLISCGINGKDPEVPFFLFLSDQNPCRNLRLKGRTALQQHTGTHHRNPGETGLLPRQSS